MIKLSDRLSAVASFINKNSIVADIGTDHAYLPIWLALNNISSKIIAADIKEGPINKAKHNIDSYGSYGLSEKITLIKTDGLAGAEAYMPDTVVIAGMGGELIVNIIKNASPDIRKKARFILQPMTRTSLLRRFLYDNRFDITGEKLAYDDRIYEIICCQYDGQKHLYSEAEILIGKKNIEQRDKLLQRHIKNRIDVIEKRINGYRRASASMDTSADEALAADLTELLNGIKGLNK